MEALNQTISLIVPVYKVEPYLCQCIDSLLAQTYTNLEIIIVDDGSPDRCPEICDSYAKKDARIKVIHKENGGLSDARNAGLDIATGAYIGFVDSDDWIEPAMYELLMQQMLQTGADISMCGHFNYVDGKYNEAGSDGSITVFNRDEAMDQLYMDQTIKSYAWDKLYRRKLLEGIRFPKGRCYEDIYIMHDVFARAEKVCYLNKCLYYYRRRAGSIAQSDKVEPYIDRLYGLKLRYTCAYAVGRDHNAAQKIFYVAQLAKRSLCKKVSFSAERRKKNKQINYYILKYCKGPTLSTKDHIIKWMLIFCPTLFYKVVKLNKSTSPYEG